MAQDVTVQQRGGWCGLESCKEGAAALGPVAVFTSRGETWEIEVCDACLIRLSSADDPGELEELNSEVAKQQTKIDKLEKRVERLQEGSS